MLRFLALYSLESILEIFLVSWILTDDKEVIEKHKITQTGIQLNNIITKRSLIQTGIQLS